MGTKDPRVDAYVDESADFAKPILRHLRGVVHAACPRVEETMKWGFPHFMYEGMLCSMASFKHHCAFGFWKGRMVVGEDRARGAEAMGHFGRITAVADLPPKSELVRYVKAAMKLNEDGVKAPGRRKGPARPAAVEVPEFFAAALAEHPAALAAFEAFSPSQRRDYVEWLAEAKGADTRRRRLATALEWLGEGKPRNWKYAQR